MPDDENAHAQTRPLWTDWPQHLPVGWGRQRNLLCKFFRKSVDLKGFSVDRPRKCQYLPYLLSSALQQSHDYQPAVWYWYWTTCAKHPLLLWHSWFHGIHLWKMIWHSKRTSLCSRKIRMVRNRSVFVCAHTVFEPKNEITQSYRWVLVEGSFWVMCFMTAPQVALTSKLFLFQSYSSGC